MALPHSWLGGAANPAASAPAATSNLFYVGEAKRLARRGRLIEMIGLVQERLEHGAVGDARAFLEVVGIHAVRDGCVSVLEQRRLPYVVEFCRALSELGISSPSDYLGRYGLQLVIDECGRLLQENRVEECIRCLERLAKCGFVVKNLVKPTLCMEACARMHNTALALRYACLLPDILQSCNMIMQKFRDQGDLQSVFQVFQALESTGVRPDMYSYCILIDACGRCGDAEKATAIFEGLLKAGTVLNVYVCNSMMNAHAGNIQHVLRLYRQMQGSGIAADVTTYNIVFKACRLSKNPVLALRLYEELKAKEIKMNVLSYGTLIQIFGEAKMLDRVFQMKHDMDSTGIVPNVVTWTSLVGACSKGALVEKTLQVYQDMVQAGCTPNAFTYNFLLSACVDGGQSDKAHKLFREWKTSGRILAGIEVQDESAIFSEWVRPDSVAYNTMMRACDKLPKQAEAVMQEMVSSGLRPDKRSWCILINSYGCNGDKQGAVQAFQRMGRSGIIADVVAYTAIIKVRFESRISFVLHVFCHRS
ncbi:pentatricopeptide repeat-containing protein At5g02830, chloroplastic [Selaginella moellendorffii]|uniref:pentatricopeptide repeat-containing protein At5g02830, chloroplastic n=1 Tax=Selaginella moellendorffii TaxID=88036 RepID=UPI000D1CA830|nr:pentatricopeptide repeat-containing protein At5g02830, chloroplastic [Selaginella moellendorffii]|eukprot:XP_024526013.1 pentatricopeptide repeat-containing protein At5g02830, chloroplastic [Selaginella moellendorffii]